MLELLSRVKNINKIFKINDNLYEIRVDVEIKVGYKIKMYLEKRDGKFYLTDKKNILKCMNEIYELSSKDVKKCLNDILLLYGFQFSKAEIFCEVDNNNIVQKYYDLIMCHAQLINMFVFFDDPV